MLTPRFVLAGTLAVLAAALSASRGTLLAQGAQRVQGGRETVQLAFGYECDDRFVLRNDGAQRVRVEYGVAGAGQRSSLDLRGNEALELSSTSSDPLELWVGGKLVAIARKGDLRCRAPGEAVVVRPIESGDYVAYVEPEYYQSSVAYGRPYGRGIRYRPAIRIDVPIFSHWGGYAAHGRADDSDGYRGRTDRGREDHGRNDHDHGRGDHGRGDHGRGAGKGTQGENRGHHG